jgi:DNA-binding protein H-NS
MTDMSALSVYDTERTPRPELQKRLNERFKFSFRFDVLEKEKNRAVVQYVRDARDETRILARYARLNIRPHEMAKWEGLCKGQYAEATGKVIEYGQPERGYPNYAFGDVKFLGVLSREIPETEPKAADPEAEPAEKAVGVTRVDFSKLCEELPRMSHEEFATLQQDVRVLEVKISDEAVRRQNARREKARAELDELERRHRAEREGLARRLGLNLAEIMSGAAAEATEPKRARRPKYRDPMTGVTWNGCGRPPVWFRQYLEVPGHSKADLLINGDARGQ